MISERILSKNSPGGENKTSPHSEVKLNGSSFEQEADQTANQIMQTTNASAMLQLKPETQRNYSLKQEQSTDLPIIQKQNNDRLDPPNSANQEKSSIVTGGGFQLPKGTLQLMNRSFGRDFSDVKVHTNNDAVKMNRELSANAFTHNQDIYFNKDQYQPQTTEGKKLLAHELTHVLQQQKSQTKVKIQRKENTFSDTGSDALSKQERAYLYRIVLSSPILNNNLSRYFKFSGTIKEYKEYIRRIGRTPIYENKPDFDDLENQITADPGLLKIDLEGLREAPPGLLAEASVKLALWKLYHELKFEVSNEEAPASILFQELQKIILNKLPETVTKEVDGTRILDPRLGEILSPNISLHKKIEILNDVKNLSIAEKKQILEAFNDSISSYINEKGQNVYTILGGSGETFESLLLAAGEGSQSKGIFGEAERRLMENIGEPIYTTHREEGRGVGLFNYQVDIQEDEEGEQQLMPNIRPTQEFKTSESEKKVTNVHFDIWGMDFPNPTTVVIRKGSDIYLFYASKDNPILTPTKDTDAYDFNAYIGDYYNKNVTPLNRKEEKVRRLKEQVSNLQDRVSTAETEIEDLREDKDEAKNKRTKQSKSFQIKTKEESIESRKDAIKEKSETLKNLEQEVTEERLLLKKPMETYHKLQSILAGNIQSGAMVSSPMEGSYYLFVDGSTFNPKTMDFKFSQTRPGESFTVQLISAPQGRYTRGKEFNPNVDEVQLFVSVVEALPVIEIEPVNFGMSDLFGSDEFQLENIPFSPIHKSNLKKIIDFLIEKDLEFHPMLFGHGIGVMKDGVVVPDNKNTKQEIESYPGDTDKSKDEFASFRLSRLAIEVENSIVIRIESFTDNVKSSLSDNATLTGKALLAKFKSKGLTDNDVLSGLRSFNMLEVLIRELENIKNDLSPEEKSILERKLNQLLEDQYTLIGNSENQVKLSYSDYLSLKKEFKK